MGQPAPTVLHHRSPHSLARLSRGGFKPELLTSTNALPFLGLHFLLPLQFAGLGSPRCSVVARQGTRVWSWASGQGMQVVHQGSESKQDKFQGKTKPDAGAKCTLLIIAFPVCFKAKFPPTHWQFRDPWGLFMKTKLVLKTPPRINNHLTQHRI